MNKKLYRNIIIIFTILAIISIAYQYYKYRNNNLNKKNTGIFSFGSTNNLSSRKVFEYMRLRNPLTNSIPKMIRIKEVNFTSKLPKKKQLKDATNINWILRGPINVGGRTRALAIDVTNENIILCGGVTGGIWRSEDGGYTYTKTTRQDQLQSVSCITQDIRKNKTNIWYCGTGEYYGIVAPTADLFSGNGIYKSTDGGLTWNLLPSTVSNTPHTSYTNGDFDYVWKIVTDHTEQTKDVVLAAVFNGIYRSEDGGNSWYPVLGLEPDAKTFSDFVDIAISPNGIFYATLSSKGPSKGIWRSEDGINWTNITPPNFPTYYNRICIGIAPSNENKVYFIAETPSSGLNNHSFWMYQYVNGNGSGNGGIWEDRTMNLPVYNCTVYYDFDFGNYSSQNSFDMYVKVKPDNENIVFLGGTNIYRSTDGFATPNNYKWIGGYKCNLETPSDYLYPNHHPDQHDLIFYPSNPSIALSAHDGGISRTYNCIEDSVKWEDLNNGYITSQFYTVAIEPGETSNDIIIGGMQDNGTWFTNSTNINKKWKYLLQGDGSYCYITKNRNNYYLSWQGAKIFKYNIDDNGNVISYRRIDPKQTEKQPYLFINPFIIDPNNENIMYLAVCSEIYRCKNLNSIELNNDELNPLETGWEPVKYANSGMLGNYITAIDMPIYPQDIMFFGTIDGKLFMIENLLTSPKKTNITSDLFPKNGYISSISTNIYNGNELMITFSNYGVKSVFYSNDRGKTWESISGNIEENSDGSGSGPGVLCGKICNTATKTLYFIGTTCGLYSTETLNGDNTIWYKEGENTMGNNIINMIAYRPYDGTIAVATHGNGIFSAKLTPYTYTNKVTGYINDELQIFPNPVIDKFNINIYIKQNTNLKISLLNSNGKLITSLYNKPLTIGNHIITFNKNNINGIKIPNGLYFIKIEFNNKNIISKILFV